MLSHCKTRSTESPAAELTTTPRADWAKIATFAAVFVAAVLAAASGLAAGEGSKSGLVLPVAIGAALTLTGS